MNIWYLMLFLLGCWVWLILFGFALVFIYMGFLGAIRAHRRELKKDGTLKELYR